MTRRLLLTLASLILLITSASAADRNTPPAAGSELSVVLVTHQSVLEANFPDGVDTLGLWLKTMTDICKRELAREKRPPLLLVQVTMDPDGPASFSLAGRPGLSRKLSERLSRALAALPDPKPAATRVTLRIQSQTDGDDPIAAARTFKPALSTPEEAAIADFDKAPLADKARRLRTWARTEAVPLLAHLAANVDNKFLGVRRTGTAVLAVDPGSSFATEALTYQSQDFWRGTMEMSPGNPLIAALPALLFTANGQFDRADSILSALVAVNDPSAFGSVLLHQLKARLDLLNKSIRREMDRGIKLHDAGRYDAAIGIYQSVLDTCPETAWARYEVFFSTYMKAGPEAVVDGTANRLWATAAPRIFACDPLYSTQFQAQRGKSMGALNDRLTLKNLPQRADATPGERLGTLAEVALHLEAYGEAAQLYWALLHIDADPGFRMINDEQVTPLTGEDLLIRFCYCIEKLGASDLKSNFSLPFETAFADLDRKLEAHRTQ